MRKFSSNSRDTERLNATDVVQDLDVLTLVGCVVHCVTLTRKTPMVTRFKSQHPLAKIPERCLHVDGRTSTPK